MTYPAIVELLEVFAVIGMAYLMLWVVNRARG